MTTIRARPSTWARNIRTAIKAGLDAELVAINTDLSSEGALYRLPTTIAASRITTTSQAAITRKDTPRVSIELGRASEAPAGLNANINDFEQPVEVSIWLGLSDLTPSAGIDTPEEQGEIVEEATQDALDALKRVIDDESNAIFGDGVHLIDPQSIQSRRRLYKIDPNSKYATACRGVLSFTLLGRKQRN